MRIWNWDISAEKTLAETRSFLVPVRATALRAIVRNIARAKNSALLTGTVLFGGGLFVAEVAQAEEKKKTAPAAQVAVAGKEQQLLSPTESNPAESHPAESHSAKNSAVDSAGTGVSRSAPAAVAPASAKPELPELVTDRPDYTESAEVVGKAIFQFESGVTLDKSTMDGERTRSLVGPLPLIRLGISKRMELRFAGEGYSWQRVVSAETAESARGRSDFSVGSKIKFVDQTKFLPDFAVISDLSVPKGSPAFRGAGYDPQVKLCLAKDGPMGFAFSSNLNFASVSDDFGRVFAKAYSLSAGHAIIGNLSGYWEAYTFTLGRDGNQSNLGYSTVFNSGLTHPIGNNVQLDVLAGHSVAGRPTGWFFGLGFSLRQPLGLMRRF